MSRRGGGGPGGARGGRGVRAHRRRGAARRHRGLGGRAQRREVRGRRRGGAERRPSAAAGAGCAVRVRDTGPGIADVAAALRDGVSTGGSLGLGLPGARRLMDDFAIEQRAGRDGRWRWRAGRAGCWPRSSPAACTRARQGDGGVNASRSRSATACCSGSPPGRAPATWRAAWRTRPWHAPAQLAEAAAGTLDPGERLGIAVAA